MRPAPTFSELRAVASRALGAARIPHEVASSPGASPPVLVRLTNVADEDLVEALGNAYRLLATELPGVDVWGFYTIVAEDARETAAAPAEADAATTYVMEYYPRQVWQSIQSWLRHPPAGESAYDIDIVPNLGDLPAATWEWPARSPSSVVVTNAALGGYFANITNYYFKPARARAAAEPSMRPWLAYHEIGHRPLFAPYERATDMTFHVDTRCKFSPPVWVVPSAALPIPRKTEPRIAANTNYALAA